MTTTLPYVKNESSEYELPYVSSFMQPRNPFSTQVTSASDFSSYTDSQVPSEAPAEPSTVIKNPNLDMEPNPFEQSFLASSSPSGTNNIAANTATKGLLPPVSSIENPHQSHDTTTSVGWGQSLRAGPLSPSMLFGPQPNISKTVMESKPVSMGPSFLDNSFMPSTSGSFNGSTTSMSYRRASVEHSRPVVTGWAEPLGIDSNNIPGANKRKGSDSSRSYLSDDSDMSRRNSLDDSDSKKIRSDMSPEEKRKLFLERNRKAALKCRQRKKQWLANLQNKVEYLTQENDSLQSQATSLREEIINLKTLLLAHKDCPVAQANGVIGLDNLVSTLDASALTMSQSMPIEGRDMASFPASVPSTAPSSTVGVAPNTIIRF
ncbi:hypothetical protein K493DRAFT_262919 [Basidiobolus meristosporus CBS 931.73]|uniref:BZIP domain-containing protein n=1 Tax=Basidiobolus meristosporus CBS 931.73 TaxID=1314790 RepID=A0A1Y1Y4P7_9FUNG|nr:hypothetical protein K493DRAFT_262919 [Basidiobolus meristosporus CBS 931.73]|eukprot:ORX93002.1 hypothetical protein K493DRAFT_262919 [Basidiobolus meristosporus CBS 931.73]